MKTEHSSKHDVVKATTLLTFLIGWGLTITVFSGNRHLAPIAVALMIGAVPAFVTVPLLLTQDEEKPNTLAVGRVLVWLQALALLVAAIIGIVITVQ
jgi:hypothetical protein